MDTIEELIGKTVLIVDDDVELADTIREQLEDIGMNVVGAAHSAKDALELIEKTDPSLLILDIRLPDMDGIELAEKINASEPRAILLLSAYHDADCIERAKASGVLTYLVKPVTTENMVPSIILTLDRFREMISLKATVDDMRESIANVECIEEAQIIISKQKRITEREAYEEIRSRSRQENRPIADIAHEIISQNA